MESPIRSGRAFDRFVVFTDGVVAIAITLQVLPLINIPGPKPGETVWLILGENAGQIVAFLFSFFVVAFQWLLHNRIVNRMDGYDGPFFWFNTLWLLGIVFLPWVTALYGAAGMWDSNSLFASDGEGFGGVGLLYWSTLAFISLMTLAMTLRLVRRPALIRKDRRAEWDEVMASRARWRGVAFPVVFVLIGIATEIIPSAAAWLPLVLIPVSIVLRPPAPSVPADETAP